jgi:DNA-binding PadR family transcriptional regulator
MCGEKDYQSDSELEVGSDLDILLNEHLETSAVLKRMHKRIIKNFLDVLVLAELRNGPMSGYDVIAFIHNKFRILVSSGTIYSMLYALERDGLIVGAWNQRKRVYRLTEKGEETIKAIMSANDKIQYLMASLLRIPK